MPPATQLKPPAPEPPGALPNAPARDPIDDCVHCGFCLPVCPTYSLWREEMDSPRGRIYLMKAGRENSQPISAVAVAHFDRCLGCMACTTACPSGVDYGKLITEERAKIEKEFHRPVSERWLRRMIYSIFPHPGRLRLMVYFLWLYQKLGVQKLLQGAGVLRRLPVSLRAMESLLPRISLPLQVLPRQAPANGTQRLKVALLTGCVQSVFFRHVHAATLRVLAAEGCQVVVPEGQGCCGSLMFHVGQLEEGKKMACQLLDNFNWDDADVVAVNAAGCGSGIKEYQHLLHNDAAHADRAAEFSSKSRDISEILAGLPPRAPRHPMELRVVYQDACHLLHAQGIHRQPRALLQSIPGLQLLEIDDASQCCGSAGIYNMIQPETAQELGDRKAARICAATPQAVVSGNPGCILQIQNALQRAGVNIPVFHWIELLDASIQGIPVAEMLRHATPSS
jgi:glycolate oxidase iron-sulfur subunit